MAKTKADWLKEAKELGLNMTTKDKIADIKAAIEATIRSTPAKEAEATPDPVDTKITKAGKHSKKGLEEAAQKAEKIARQQGVLDDNAADAPSQKGPTPTTRLTIERRSKKYRAAAKQIDRSQTYDLRPALELAVKTSVATFDASVELHIRLGVDPKQADQNIRGMVKLPSGTGKTIRIAVLAPSDAHAAAKKAGADIAGEKDLLEQIGKEILDFDVLIATPEMMPALGRYAKILGPKGLMPNPKSSTVATDVAEAVNEAKAGKVEFRVDKQGIVHVAVGKVSFGPDKLTTNTQAVLDAIKAAKPASIKGLYVLSTFITTSMGPSIRINA